jgi:hypothetical protein
MHLGKCRAARLHNQKRLGLALVTTKLTQVMRFGLQKVRRHLTDKQQPVAV